MNLEKETDWLVRLYWWDEHAKNYLSEALSEVVLERPGLADILTWYIRNKEYARFGREIGPDVLEYLERMCDAEERKE